MCGAGFDSGRLVLEYTMREGCLQGIGLVSLGFIVGVLFYVCFRECRIYYGFLLIVCLGNICKKLLLFWPSP